MASKRFGYIVGTFQCRAVIPALLTRHEHLKPRQKQPIQYLCKTSIIREALNRVFAGRERALRPSSETYVHAIIYSWPSHLMFRIIYGFHGTSHIPTKTSTTSSSPTHLVHNDASPFKLTIYLHQVFKDVEKLQNRKHSMVGFLVNPFHMYGAPNCNSCKTGSRQGGYA